MTKTYKELITINNFLDRFKYLKLNTKDNDKYLFHSKRYLNQIFYTSQEWIRIRRDVIIRDDGCDLACKDRPIRGLIYVHHIDPISYQDLLERNPKVVDKDNLISVSIDTHNAIHYGNESMLVQDYVERFPNDTCPWKL